MLLRIIPAPLSLFLQSTLYNLMSPKAAYRTLAALEPFQNNWVFNVVRIPYILS